MANKNLFSKPGAQGQHVGSVPNADTKNEAGGKAYSMSNEAALAQFVATSCLNGTFHTSAKDQLDTVKKLLAGCTPEFIGKVAIYGRQSAFMKDLPALCISHLAADNGGGKNAGDPSRRSAPSWTGGPTTPEQEAKQEVLNKVFPHVIDSGTMVRNFVQMIRSGVLGRKSLGYSLRHLVRQWFENRSPATIFHNSIGNNPTLGEVIRIARPKPNTPEKAALFAYLTGAKVVDDAEGKVLRTYFKDDSDGQVKVAYEHPFANLPQIVQQFEAWKADQTLPQPKLNFRFLDGIKKLSTAEWTEIARNANWLTTLKSMNTYKEHGVFDQPGMVELISARLADANEVAKVRVFPYQILIAYLASEGKAPQKVRDALHDALEAATRNVPVLTGKVYICVDVSGSMTTGRVTGDRGSATTAARCIDVAALYAASLLRVNKSAEVIPFEVGVVLPSKLTLEPRDTVMTNARKLASIGGGGTNCSAPLNMLNQRNAKGDVVVFVSDYESWADGPNAHNGKATAMLEQWAIFKKRNPDAKLVCIDLTPRANHQVVERPDILQVGGFSDNVFNVVARFAESGWDKNFWLQEINKIDLDALGDLCGSKAKKQDAVQVEVTEAVGGDEESEEQQ
jgi:60 kDa SS-A/Ro ribonucleoprotein